MNRINGKSFDVRLLGARIHVESFTLNIEDESGVATTAGMPDGNLKGNVKASGEITLDPYQFDLLSAAARAAGSWQDLPAFLIDAYAEGGSSRGNEFMHVRAHDCKLRLSDLLNVDPNSTDKTTVKIKFDVTGPDFVWINGTPYLSESGFSLI